MLERLNKFTDEIELFDSNVLYDLVDAIGEEKAMAIYAQAPKTISEICQAAVASGGEIPNYRDALNHCHELKGVSGNLGFLALHALVDTIVMHLRNEERQAALEHLALLPEMLELSLAAAISAQQNP